MSKGGVRGLDKGSIRYVRCDAVGGSSGGEANNLKFGVRVDARENLVDSKHGLVLQLRITALTALKDREGLQNHD